MIDKDSEWIFPENLKKQEKKARKLIDEGKGNTDHGGDFGSYYAYRKGINYDYIKPHACSNDHKALSYAKNLRAFLKSANLRLEGEILDVGCAIGTITNAIDVLSKEKRGGGRTHGLDISEDGIEVARQKYQNCIFYEQSADDLSNFDDGSFDIIHCREFYPFTRTNDEKYHMKYLKLFYNKLKPHGFVILTMVSLDNGLVNTYEKLENRLKNIGYSDVKKNMKIPTTQYNKLFGQLLYKRPLYGLLKMVARTILTILRKRVKYFYILAK